MCIFAYFAIFPDGTISSLTRNPLQLMRFVTAWPFPSMLTMIFLKVGITMINVKKAVFILCVAAGFSASVSTTAYALPDRETCEAALVACVEEGDQGQCNLVTRLCGVYGIHL